MGVFLELRNASGHEKFSLRLLSYSDHVALETFDDRVERRSTLAAIPAKTRNPRSCYH